MGLFDKKFCSICGAKIGLFGNRKLEDGNLCKNCASKLSPWMTDRRQSTVEEIKQHLAYREQNKAAVAAFHATKTFGNNTKVIIDEDAGKFLVSSQNRWQEDNPDVLDLTQATGCTLNVRENQHEQYMKDKDGMNKSYNPPRYTYDYDFEVTIAVDSPYFQEIFFHVNDWAVERSSAQYHNCENLANDICDYFNKTHQEIRASAAAAAAPKAKVTCPHCGATTEPDANGCCQFCGGALDK